MYRKKRTQRALEYISGFKEENGRHRPLTQIEINEFEREQDAEQKWFQTLIEAVGLEKAGHIINSERDRAEWTQPYTN